MDRMRLIDSAAFVLLSLALGAMSGPAFGQGTLPGRIDKPPFADFPESADIGPPIGMASSRPRSRNSFAGVRR